MDRLTPAQRRLLIDLAKRGDLVDEKYRPGIRLVELGLAEKGSRAFGVVNLYITEAGRRALDVQTEPGEQT